MQLKQKQKIIYQEVQAALTVEPAQSAAMVGLRYFTDDTCGIQRRRAGKGFYYVSSDGERITDKVELNRIKSLAIPPAWHDVWICPLPHGHLQATGWDAKGRKQYRYHPHWREVRSQAKFNRMIAFAEALPKIRLQTQSDLALRGLPRAKVLATVIRLLELTQIRVGNEEYATTNRSFGLTTMRERHVDVSGSKIEFNFRGKSGVEHDIALSDRSLAKIVKRCQDLPGQELFQYLDEDGQHQPIDSGDVNDYLREATSLDFTAKDFRTWSGTVLAAIELNELGVFETKTEAKKNITQAIKDVAKQLGNRPATCRKYYVHPAILDAYQNGTLCQSMPRSTQQKTATATQDLQPEEQVVLQLLKQHLLQENQKLDNN